MTTNELLSNIGIAIAIMAPITAYVIGQRKARNKREEEKFAIEKMKVVENSVGSTKIKEIEEHIEKVKEDIEKINQVSENDKREDKYILKIYEELKKDYWELMKLVREILKGNK